MIEKLDKHLASNINSCNMSQNIMVAHKAIEKINEIVELLNAIVVDIDGTKCIDGSKTRSENVQPDAESRPENVQDPVCFISTTYPSDNKTTVFLGQKGASVEFNQPLPAGFIITIKKN